VAAARDMLSIIAQFNLDQAAASKPEIRLGIGIATGEVVAGYAGTQHRATYTCIGDKVNLASRLEGYTKKASCPILIDETTRTAVQSSQSCKPVGQVKFDGFLNPVEVFSVDPE
jgi:class 3 adenylate cyclase